MRFIETFREGNHISDVYLCKTKQIALTKNGKEYGSLVLQDKTGTVDAKIWELSSPGINEFSALDYVLGLNQIDRGQIRIYCLLDRCAAFTG